MSNNLKTSEMEKIMNELAIQAGIIVAEAAKKDSKAGHQRIRKATLQIAKLGKEYRKLSIEADKSK